VASLVKVTFECATLEALQAAGTALSAIDGVVLPAWFAGFAAAVGGASAAAEPEEKKARQAAPVTAAAAVQTPARSPGEASCPACGATFRRRSDNSTGLCPECGKRWSQVRWVAKKSGRDPDLSAWIARRRGAPSASQASASA
jgi:hypothetical protein